MQEKISSLFCLENIFCFIFGTIDFERLNGNPCYLYQFHYSYSIFSAILIFLFDSVSDNAWSRKCNLMLKSLVPFCYFNWVFRIWKRSFLLVCFNHKYCLRLSISWWLHKFLEKLCWFFYYYNIIECAFGWSSITYNSNICVGQDLLHGGLHILNQCTCYKKR